MFGRLLKVQGNKVEIELDDEFDFNKVERFANGKQPVVELNVNDGRTITPDQRKKIWALLNDFCRYTGYSLDEAEIFHFRRRLGILSLIGFRNKCFALRKSFALSAASLALILLTFKPLEWDAIGQR